MSLDKTQPTQLVQIEEAARPLPDARDVLERLGVDPVEHFAQLLLGADVGEKRKDAAAKLLLPYCYARKAPKRVSAGEKAKLVGFVICED